MKSSMVGSLLMVVLAIVLLILCVNNFVNYKSSECYEEKINMYCVPKADIVNDRFVSNDLSTVNFQTYQVKPKDKPTCPPNYLATIYKPGVCIDCLYPQGTGRMCGKNNETNEQVVNKCKELGGQTNNQKFLKFI